MEATQENGGNAGLVERRRHIAGSRVVEMMGRLHVDLFMQDRFLINGVTVKIRLVRSKDAFSLMAGGANPDYKVRIVDAVLFVRKAVLSPTVAMAHIRALEKGTAKYPLRPVDCKVYSIPQGALSSTHENLFLGTLPKRIILWCVDNDALNGAFGKNPFHAKNNAINFLAVYVDGRQVPAKPLQPNFADFMTEHCSTWSTNERTLQSPLSTVCGQYCVAFLMFRCRDASMNAFTRLFTTDLVANDCRVFDWVAAVNKK